MTGAALVRGDIAMTHDQSSHDRAHEEAGRPDITSLASTVISVLNDKSDEMCRYVRASMLDRIVTTCLGPSGYDADLLITTLRENRLSPDQIMDLYIPEAARDLGQKWVTDEISFAQVTIATARLQGLLTLLTVPWYARPPEPENQMLVLMSLQANDTHTLGPHVAIAQLRRLGVSVRVLFGADGDAIARALADDSYDLVMFSCSDTDTLATISKIVTRIRSLVPDPPPIALGGLVLGLADRVKERTAVDLVTCDVRVAYKLCEKKRPKLKTVAL